jgi:hypothetical protein
LEIFPVPNGIFKKVAGGALDVGGVLTVGHCFCCLVSKI